MQNVQVKFGEWMQKGFTLYNANFGILVLVSLVALVISIATAGILAGPMIAGFFLITLGLMDKKSPKSDMGTLFQGFRYFLNSFLFILVWTILLFVASAILSLIPLLGSLASLFVIYAVQTFLMFGMFLIVEKNMEFWPASMESFETVKTAFWPLLGFCVVTAIIGSIGAVGCGISVIFTAPIQGCMLTAAYRDVFDKSEAPVATNPPL
jgi:MFS family permease